jgi:hypothetical protein
MNLIWIFWTREMKTILNYQFFIDALILHCQPLLCLYCIWRIVKIIICTAVPLPEKRHRYLGQSWYFLSYRLYAYLFLIVYLYIHSLFFIYIKSISIFSIHIYDHIFQLNCFTMYLQLHISFCHILPLLNTEESSDFLYIKSMMQIH